MKKNNYFAPTLEQVRMEAEMPVMAGSVGPSPSPTTGNLKSFSWK